jgi:uncharacterized membrane protein YecN with MAPEG domain
MLLLLLLLLLLVVTDIVTSRQQDRLSVRAGGSGRELRAAMRLKDDKKEKCEEERGVVAHRGAATRPPRTEATVPVSARRGLRPTQGPGPRSSGARDGRRAGGGDQGQSVAAAREAHLKSAPLAVPQAVLVVVLMEAQGGYTQFLMVIARLLLTSPPLVSRLQTTTGVLKSATIYGCLLVRRCWCCRHMCDSSARRPMTQVLVHLVRLPVRLCERVRIRERNYGQIDFINLALEVCISDSHPCVRDTDSRGY